MGWPGADVSGGARNFTPATFVLGGGSSTASTASRRSSLVGVVLSAAILRFFLFFAGAFVNFRRTYPVLKWCSSVGTLPHMRSAARSASLAG